MKIAVLGNFLPRRCGIATFTQNLCNAITNTGISQKNENEVFVVAMNDNNIEYEYPPVVKYTVRQNEKEEYIAAAAFINNSGADICIVQHEFGIYGGESGVYLLSLVSELQMPVITTLHTILKSPSYHEKHIIKKLAQLSQKLVVMSKLAVNHLTTIYKTPLQKIAIIHHGVPDFALEQISSGKFSYPGKKVLGTFGFLGRSKGIETVINALPDVVKRHPDVLYVVLGQTHPNVKRYSGEEYRNYLKELAVENGVADHVVFEDGFVSEEELKTFLVNTDIYITPYLNEGQITSGTISYALGAGACIVSTPFWHAVELLDGGRGVLFPFGDSAVLAAELSALLDNPEKSREIGRKAFEFGEKMYWVKIGARYNKVIGKITADFKAHSVVKNRTEELPLFSLEHVKRLTDNTGITEHACYSVPDYKEGYCLDDNARALLLTLYAVELGFENPDTDLINTYLHFIKLMQQPGGLFHNDLTFGKKYADETGSEDSFGRTVWAIGTLVRMSGNDSHFQFAKDIFFQSVPNFEKLQSIRAIANTILGICNFLNRYPDNERILQLLNLLTNKLLAQYQAEATESWKWFEPVLCYDNALLPLALWEAYAVTKNNKIKITALETTDFLKAESCKKGHLSLVGNTWYYKGKEKPAQGQQPVNAMALVMMYKKAWQVTKDELYYKQMLNAFSWFTGNNDLGIPLFDEETSGCCDGLEAASVNRNQGAESTIAYLLSYLTVYEAELKADNNLRYFFSQAPVRKQPDNLIPFTSEAIRKVKAN